MEYSLEFSERLIDAGNSIARAAEGKDDAGRAALYLSLLSCEVSLKALLERAGFTVRELRKRSHDLKGLLQDICSCELAGTGISGSKPFRASRLLSQEVIENTSNGTVGALLHAEEVGASKYPNDIRYGDLVTHFPPLVMLKCASILHGWAKDNIDIIRRISS